MTRKNQSDISGDRASDPHETLGNEPQVAPVAAADPDRDARDREVFERFEEDSLLVTEILARQLREASCPEANEPYYHSEIEEEMEALKRHTKQIQEIIGYLQTLKKLYDRRRKDLRELRDWVRSQGREHRGR